MTGGESPPVNGRIRSQSLANKPSQRGAIMSDSNTETETKEEDARVQITMRMHRGVFQYSMARCLAHHGKGGPRPRWDTQSVIADSRNILIALLEQVDPDVKWNPENLKAVHDAAASAALYGSFVNLLPILGEDTNPDARHHLARLMGTLADEAEALG